MRRNGDEGAAAASESQLLGRIGFTNTFISWTSVEITLAKQVQYPDQCSTLISAARCQCSTLISAARCQCQYPDQCSALSVQYPDQCRVLSVVSILLPKYYES